MRIDPRISLVTPKRRADSMPDEFVVKKNLLFCRWCKKPLTSLRMDNLRLHLRSAMHKENKLKLGGSITINNISKKQLEGGDMKFSEKDAYDYTSSNSSCSDDDDVDDDDEVEEEETEEQEEQLSLLFDDSDSEDSEPFEGFEEEPDLTKKNPSRIRRRPSRLLGSVELTTRKRKRHFSNDTSPSLLHSPARKRRISYNAKSSSPPSKKAKLKIKIRKPKRPNSKSFQVESSEPDESGFSEGRHVAYKQPGDGLKMKFVLNKHKSPHGRKGRRRSENYSSDDTRTYNRQSPKASPSFPDNRDVGYDHEQEHEIYEGVQEVVEEEIVNDDVEVVEEEIVGVDDGEVVSWDAVIGEEEDTELVEEEIVAPETPLQPETELTSAESLAIKANYAREMAKAVNSAQFKKKRLIMKKTAKLEEKQKRKVSAYNLWSSRMRKQVASQYPGLQFGEVSKKLGNLWKKIPDKEKKMWKNRSDKMANRLGEMQSNTTKRNKGSKMIETGPKKKHVSPKRLPRQQQTIPFTPHKNPEQAMQRELLRLPTPSIEPIDAAAHFRLLGQSLYKMGREVQSSRTCPHTNKVIPLMLNSVLCSFVPLLSLTNQIPDLEGSIDDNTMASMYCNLAHLMPGF